MIHDHRPYIVKRAYQGFEQFYGKHFIAPQFASLGPGYHFMKPWHMRVHGANIAVGDHAHIIAASDRKVNLVTWRTEEHQGHITIGSQCLICPGVRIDSANSITIGDNTMIAAGSYVTDADWHDIYDRTQAVGNTAPVELGCNVWVGDGATVCKGVTIGDNSVVGASSVVVSDIGPNSVAVGNPARVIKELDSSAPMVTRASLFEDPAELSYFLEQVDRYVLRDNSLFGWLRAALWPRPGD